ncbi:MULTISPECIES: MmgE/PrpD family protein [unclassified Pseudomonas]|uniref:MmgE/PrpD family protein n=1 Tax=unclassified Pseudomonas TaxID=196821 RepID=UPI0025CCFD5D|nr:MULTISPECIES: MmgE/PrpD family protein [unclassified Pseudomonas]
MPSESVTSSIACAALALDYGDLPDTVIEKASMLIADILLVAAAGKAQSSSIAMGQALAPSSGNSQVWFADRREPRSAMDATFLNVLHAGALDYDSLNGAVHADLVTLPAAWAVAEEYARLPRQLLTAYVAASEMVSRLSRCAAGVSKGWSGTSLYGGMGAALASGLLMGLDAAQLTHALGLAAVQAAGTQQANVEQTLAKRLQPAFAARNGVFAARLAQAGATAPAQALEGKFGLRALYQPGDDGGILEGWGNEWQILDTAIKGFPVCACSHAAIQALLDLTTQARCSAREVVEVVATISPFMSRLVGGDFSVQGDLEVVAQFNLRYHLASVLLRGPVTLAALSPEAIREEALQALVSRIHLVVDPGNPNELAPTSVSLTLSDGRTLERTCDAMPGSAQAPMTHRQWQEKLGACAAQARPSLPPARLTHLLRALDAFPELASLNCVWEAS